MSNTVNDNFKNHNGNRFIVIPEELADNIENKKQLNTLLMCSHLFTIKKLTTLDIRLFMIKYMDLKPLNPVKFAQYVSTYFGITEINSMRGISLNKKTKISWLIELDFAEFAGEELKKSTAIRKGLISADDKKTKLINIQGDGNLEKINDERNLINAYERARNTSITTKEEMDDLRPVKRMKITTDASQLPF
ncbi:MAG: hypothetical protein ACRC42_01255 [Mycoplasma sp.]